MRTHDNSIISKLEPNQIFVFGSNTEGRHAGGAAKVAADKFGAKMGVSEGLTGNSYAFPTMHWGGEVLPLNKIKKSFETLLNVVKDNPDKEFILTKVGCGIAGFSVEEIAPALFVAIKDLGETEDSFPNLVIPEDFVEFQNV